MLMFFPSLHPRSRRPSRNAWYEGAVTEDEVCESSAIRRTVVGACARTAPAQASAPAPSAITSLRRLFTSLSELPFEYSTQRPLASSLDHFRRLRQQRLGKLDAEGFGGFSVDHQFEFCRLFDGQISGFRSLENFVDVCG